MGGGGAESVTTEDAQLPVKDYILTTPHIKKRRSACITIQEPNILARHTDPELTAVIPLILVVTALIVIGSHTVPMPDQRM